MFQAIKGSPCSSGSSGSQGEATAWRRKKTCPLSSQVGSSQRDKKSRLSGNSAASPVPRTPLAELGSCTRPSSLAHNPVTTFQNPGAVQLDADPTAKRALQTDCFSSLPAPTSAAAATALGWGSKPLQLYDQSRAHASSPAAKQLASATGSQRFADHADREPLMLHVTGSARHGANAAMALPGPKPEVAQKMPLDQRPQNRMMPPQSEQQQPRTQTKQPQHVLEQRNAACTQQQQQQQQEAEGLSMGFLLTNRHEVSDEVSQLAQFTC